MTSLLSVELADAHRAELLRAAARRRRFPLPRPRRHQWSGGAR
ncbi:hypothetical protein ACFFX1_19740 [Dactylosporangium sucinum]|nr:hypothetical protein [Dactylosporangium sucinum]